MQKEAQVLKVARRGDTAGMRGGYRTHNQYSGKKLLHEENKRESVNES